jgi:FKBP-type peptidyl-prolyl cis-trans isomerase (trigger factor)
VVDTLVKTAEIDGFRKGKAPKAKVLETVDEAKLNGEVVNILLQKYYPQALKEHHIMPVSNPKVEIKDFNQNQNFRFTATVATRPEVKIGDYKAEIKKSYEEKNKQFKELNAEKLKKGEKIDTDHIHLTANDVLDAVNKVTDVDIADILIEDEVNRMLTRLINQAQAVNLSLEQYLESQGKTAESLKEEYSKVAKQNLAAEFALSKLITDNKVEVSDEEVEKMINATGDIQAKEQMQNENEKWYIKSVLAKNKLISELIEEAQGVSKHE